jgi:hypothetical protein
MKTQVFIIDPATDASRPGFKPHVTDEGVQQYKAISDLPEDLAVAIVILHSSGTDLNTLAKWDGKDVRFLESRDYGVNYDHSLSGGLLGRHLEGRSELGLNGKDQWRELVALFLRKSWHDALKAFEQLTTPKVDYDDIVNYLREILCLLSSPEENERKRANEALKDLRPKLGMEWIAKSQ